MKYQHLTILITAIHLLFLNPLINTLYAQRDTLYFKDGSKRVGTIGTFGSKNYRFLEIGGSKYEKINNDDVTDYYIGDNFFVMSDNKRMEAEFIYELPGYNRDDIYRAVVDWILANQKLIYPNGIQITNKENAIVIGSLFSQEYYRLDFAALVDALEGVISTYSINYTIKMRAKEGKLKLYISDIEAVNSIDLQRNFPFIDLYKRRVNKEGKQTNNLREIKIIKALLEGQLLSIGNYVEYFRLNDTYEANLIKSMLMDNEW